MNGQFDGEALEIGNARLERCRQAWSANGGDTEQVKPHGAHWCSGSKAHIEFEIEWELEYKSKVSRINSIPQTGTQVSGRNELGWAIPEQMQDYEDSGKWLSTLKNKAANDPGGFWVRARDFGEYRTALLPAFYYLDDCASCDGVGNHRCGACHGSGKTNCPNCRGTNCVDCRACNGEGRHRQDYNGQYVTCSRCGGSGEESCSSCGPNGKVDCLGCKGSGKIPCDSCNETGLLGEHHQTEVVASSNRAFWEISAEDEIRSRLNADIKAHRLSGATMLKDGVVRSSAPEASPGVGQKARSVHEVTLLIATSHIDIPSRLGQPKAFTFYDIASQAVGEVPKFMAEVLEAPNLLLQSVRHVAHRMSFRDLVRIRKEVCESGIVDAGLREGLWAYGTGERESEARKKMTKLTKEGLSRGDIAAMAEGLSRMMLRLSKGCSWWAWIGIAMIVLPVTYHVEMHQLASHSATAPTNAAIQVLMHTWYWFFIGYIASRILTSLSNAFATGYVRLHKPQEVLPAALIITGMIGIIVVVHIGK